MTITTWDTDAGDHLYATESNWDNGCPTGNGGGGDAAAIIGAGDAIFPSGAALGLSLGITFADYTGAASSDGDHTTITLAQAEGDFVLSAGMTGATQLRAGFDGSSRLDSPTCHLTSAGQTLQSIFTATNNASDLTIALTDDARSYFFQLRDAFSVLALGVHTLYTLCHPTEGGYFEMIDGSRVTYSAGAKLIFDTTGTLPMEMNIGGTILSPLPPIEITGTGSIIQDTANPIIAASLLVEDCVLNGGVWHIVGTCVAYNATITGCDFSGGTQLTAINCTDGGGNTNVCFTEDRPVTTTMNNFGCDSDAVIGKLTTGTYAPTVAELGGQAVVDAAIASAVDQIIESMPEEVFIQVTQIDMQFLELRASAGQTRVNTSFAPILPGKLYIWEGQPRFFKERPHKKTDLLSDDEFFDDSLYRPLAEDVEGVLNVDYTRSGETITWLTTTADYAVNNTTGVVVFREALVQGDQVMASYMPDVDDEDYVIRSLAACAADGAAYLLASKLYPRASTQWQYLDVLQEQFTNKLSALQAKTWIPPELRLMSFWKEVEPSGGDNGAKIKVGKLSRG